MTPCGLHPQILIFKSAVDKCTLSQKEKKSCWHLLYAGSLNIHQALERCWTVQSHPDEEKPSALDCLNTMRLNRSWRVNRCRDQFTTYKLFYSKWKCKLLFLKSWLIASFLTHISNAAWESPKHWADRIGTNIIIRLCYIVNEPRLNAQKGFYWKWITRTWKGLHWLKMLVFNQSHAFIFIKCMLDKLFAKCIVKFPKITVDLELLQLLYACLFLFFIPSTLLQSALCTAGSIVIMQ